jgi:hypothetical protein
LLNKKHKPNERDDQIRTILATLPILSPRIIRVCSSVIIEWNGVMPMPPATKMSVLESVMQRKDNFARILALLVVVCASIGAVNVDWDVVAFALIRKAMYMTDYKPLISTWRASCPVNVDGPWF